MKKLLLLILFPTFSFCQLSLTSFPQDYQLYPREANNRATVSIMGTYVDTKAEKLVLQIFKNDSLKYSIESPKSNFDFEVSLNAELSEYGFKLFSSQKSQLTLLKQANKVLCGDAIVLYGQSNMVALNGVNEFNSTKSDQFMRNFEVSYTANNTIDTSRWYPAKLPYTKVGTLASYLMLSLIDSLKIPFCAINGAVGGANIKALSKRNPDNALDSTFYYGKLLNRIKLSGLSNQVKYMAYFQGEAEAGTWYVDCNSYPDNYKTLVSNLFTDIPSLLKLYEFQINILRQDTVNKFVERAGFLRDFQRKTGELYPGKIVPLTAIGVVPYDGVHFQNLAYMHLGEDLAQLLIRDFYGALSNQEIEHPNIKYAYYNDNKTNVTLVFQENQKLSYPQDLNFGSYTRRLQDFIYLTSDNQSNNYNQFNSPVVSGKANGNTVVLEFSKPQNDLYITYLPATFSDVNSAFYNGPHLTNSKGLHAFSFYCVPILSTKPTYGNIPKTPLNFSANGVSNSQINITWDSNSSISDHYILDVSIDSTVYTSINVNGSLNSYLDKNKDPDKKYYYRLKACNANGCSDFTNIKSTKTFRNNKQDCPNLEAKFLYVNLNTNSLNNNGQFGTVSSRMNLALLVGPNYQPLIGKNNIGVFTPYMNLCN